MLFSLIRSRGKGLGKKEDGEVEVLQIKRREEGQALGAESQTAAANFKWGDQFWVDVYNKATSNLATIVNTNKKGEGKKKDKKSKKKSKIESDDDESDFDGEIVIQSSHKKKQEESKKIKKTKTKGRERSDSGVSSRLRKGSSRKNSVV